MVYKLQTTADDIKDGKCPECGSKRLMLKGGKLSCTNCGHVIGTTFNKYGAKRTEFNGKLYDSKYEAGVAAELETRKRAKDIKDYDTQYKVEIPVCRQDGTVAFTVKHKIDFRLHMNDGSYELWEAKGVETPDYKWRRRLLEEVWLPEHLDHTYTVLKQNVRRK